jgi:two-component system, NtrC family, response regulator HydG
VGGQPRTVLVVDDEQAIRLLCRVNLELEGYDVLEARNLADARALLERGGIDLVLLDVHVGSEDGWTLADELRDSESGVRVALLTGSVDISSAEAKRVDAVVRKPFSLDHLIATVADLSRTGASCRS